MTCVCKDRCAVDEYGSTVAPCKRVELDESGAEWWSWSPCGGCQEWPCVCDTGDVGSVDE